MAFWTTIKKPSALMKCKKHEEFFQDSMNPPNYARIRTSNFDRLQVAEKNLVVQIITAPGCLPLCWHAAAPEAEMSDSLLNWFQSHCSVQPVYYSQLKLVSVNVNELGWTWCGFRSILVTKPGAFAVEVGTAMREQTGEGFNLLLSLPEPLFPTLCLRH